MQTISIRGCKTHNLKNVSCDLPRDQLIVITGPSGSGKSSLAFDTLYSEGQRRYVESLSAYARQFLSMMDKPEVDHIEGLSPAISIEQKTTSHNPRSTVGTITEIYDYLRLLYARAGKPHCPEHDHPLDAQTVTQMVDAIMDYPEGSKLMILAPVIDQRKGEYSQLFTKLAQQGYIRAMVDGEVIELDEPPTLDKRKKHTIEVVVDRIVIKPGLENRLAESLETALQLAEDRAIVQPMASDSKSQTKRQVFSGRFACPSCGYSLKELEPRLFSFNNPAGACSECDGLGVHSYFDEDKLVKAELSLDSGAIRGWDKRHSYYYSMLSSLAKHYKFSLDVPYKKLPKKVKKVLMYGSGDEVISFLYENDRGTRFSKKRPFAGVIPNLQRRYRETDSGQVRDDLAKYMSTEHCPGCDGTRLSLGARNVFIKNRNLPFITELPIGEAKDFFTKLKLSGRQGKIAEKIVAEIKARLEFLVNVGLDYLTLSRSADTLSGGEAQRIRLASQIGAGLVGVMYILDEPTIGLHQRDNERLLATLTRLRDLGNTIIVVEHDEDTMRIADHIIDIGPGAGVHGGKIVAEGPLKDILNNPKSLTGDYLSGRKAIAVPEQRTKPTPGRCLEVVKASGNNLRDVTVSFPLGLMTGITGVSGSGKSTLINHTLYPLLLNALPGTTAERKPAANQGINGTDLVDKIIAIDQSPIGRTPRSNPATYSGIFTPIRELFAGTHEARSRGYKPGRFSFNVKGGRCEACQGDGVTKVEMHFLPDIYVTCDVCHGKRYNRETLEVHYKGKNILEVLDMTVEDARRFFDAIPILAKKLQTLLDVGLGYITLGQNATTLSGGEAQRVKLARELSKRATGKTVYLLDEPTTGLHFNDVAQLLKVLSSLKESGNSIIIIEHNLDVIKCCDWLIDLGPDGGAKGGRVVASGTPEDVAKSKKSETGRFLRPLLSKLEKVAG